MESLARAAVYDADEMRRRDAGRSRSRGASLELMETAGRRWPRRPLEVARPGRSRGRLRQGQQRRRRAGRRPPAAAELGFEVEALLLWRRRTSSPTTPTRTSSAFDGARAPVDAAASSPAALAGSGVVVDAIFGTGFAGAPRDPGGRPRSRRSTPPAPRSSRPTSPRAWTRPPARSRGRAVEADVTVTFHAAKLGHWIAPGQGAHRRAAGGRDRDSRRGAGRAAAGADRDGVLDLAPRRGAGLDQVQLRPGAGRRRLARADRAPSAWRPRRRSGSAPATRRWRCPADLEPIFEVKLTEVMSVGLRRGARGACARPRPSAILAAAERAGRVVLGPGLGRERGTRELARELAQRIEAPLLIDADGLNAHAGRLGAARRAAARRPCSPLMPASSAGCSDATPTRSARTGSPARARRRSARGRDRRAQGGRHDRRRRRARRGQRAASPALATAGTGDVLSRHDRRAARARHGSLRGRLRRPSTPTRVPGGSPRERLGAPSR